jgi:hypothetical protein
MEREEMLNELKGLYGKLQKSFASKEEKILLHERISYILQSLMDDLNTLKEEGYHLKD